MVTLCGLALLALFGSRKWIQVRQVTTTNHLVMLGTEIVHNELLPQRAHLIERARIAMEPRESLLTDRGVHTLQALLQEPVLLGGAYTLLVVLLVVPLVDDVVLDLLELVARHAFLLVFTIPVHDERVNLLVQPEDLLQALRDDSIVLRIDLALDTDNPLGLWINDHEPSMTEAFLFLALVTFGLGLTLSFRPCIADLGKHLLMSISNQLFHQSPPRRWKLMCMKKSGVLGQGWKRDFVANDDLLVQGHLLELLEGHVIEQSLIVLFVKLGHDVLRAKRLFVRPCQAGTGDKTSEQKVLGHFQVTKREATVGAHKENLRWQLIEATCVDLVSVIGLEVIGVLCPAIPPATLLDVMLYVEDTDQVMTFRLDLTCMVERAATFTALYQRSSDSLWRKFRRLEHNGLLLHHHSYNKIEKYQARTTNQKSHRTKKTIVS